MRNVKTFKKMVIFMLAMVMAFSSIGATAATTYKKSGRTVTYRGRSFTVYYNSKKANQSSKPGVFINDNYMIPYKTCLVNNGPKMASSYDKATKKITLTYNGKTVLLYLNKKYMYVNNVKYKLNTAPVQVNYSGKKCIVIPAKAVCKNAFNMGYSYSYSKKKIYLTGATTTTNAGVDSTTTTTTTPSSNSNLVATSFNGMTTAQFIAALGPIAQANYEKTGVLASVTMAQAINESGWGKSGLTQKSNNMFGMKISLSGNTWSGSTWDGKSYVNVYTTEEYNGKKVQITAKFRKYSNVAQSVDDHSAYLLNAKNGSSNRYAGLAATTSYSKQLTILQKGGYCTWSGYVSELTTLIKKYNLTQFDK